MRLVERDHMFEQISSITSHPSLYCIIGSWYSFLQMIASTKPAMR
jgi:hypothetical protein